VAEDEETVAIAVTEENKIRLPSPKANQINVFKLLHVKQMIDSPNRLAKRISVCGQHVESKILNKPGETSELGIFPGLFNTLCSAAKQSLVWLIGALYLRICQW
jgi:hypothetical protein